MLPSKVCTFYRCSPEGFTALSYAASLAKAIGSGELTIYLERSPRGEADDAVQTERILSQVSLKSCLDRAFLNIELFDRGSSPRPGEDCIVVDRRLAGVATGQTCAALSPFEESSVSPRTGGPLLIPFGDGLSGPRAARLGVPLARQLNRAVIFYHTSWREPGVASADPRDHVCDTARKNWQELEAMAAEHGVACSTVIECTDDTVEGIVQCAMRQRAGLIVMSRRQEPGIGCYVSRILSQSPVPLLIQHPKGR